MFTAESIVDWDVLWWIFQHKKKKKLKMLIFWKMVIHQKWFYIVAVVLEPIWKA